jgi:hypothetical protein
MQAKVSTIAVIQLFDHGFNLMPQSLASQHKYDFQSLVLTAKEEGLEIGETFDDEGNGYEYHVKRIDDNIYKICFHTYDEESDEESDPLAMD